MISAVIFDLDGTVFDNEGIWEEAFRAVARKSQISIPKSQGWIHEPGIGLSANWRKLASKPDVEDLSRQTRKKYLEIVESGGGLQIREGFVELVEAVKDRGWQTALATTGEWPRVEQELVQLDLYLAFDVTTTGEEVLAQKPDPEIYLLTGQKLGLEPRECIVLEDSISGVKAASLAGMVPVGIVGGYATKVELKKAGANLVVDNLNDVMVGLAEHE